MGNFLKTGGVMAALVREASGQFTIDETVRLSDITSPGDIAKTLIPLNEVLGSLGVIRGTEEDVLMLKDGKTIALTADRIERENRAGRFCIEYENRVLAVGSLKGLSFKPEKVLI